MIDTQALRNKILDLAMRGKLVEQRPEEGTGEELYQKILAEKARLVKEGKIKKQKPLPEITEDEKPFEIPESWKWVHIDIIGESSLGKTLNKSLDKGYFVNYLCSINIRWDGIDLTQLKSAYFSAEEKEKYKLKKGDLLICEGGDIGRSAVWEKDTEMYYQNALHRVRFFEGINPFFYKYLIQFYKNIGLLDNVAKGVTIRHLVQNALYSLWIPLAPIEEQNRIITCLKSVFNELSYLDKLQMRYIDSCFVLKSKLLDTAIRGDLVEQRIEEGTGEGLYQQIQKEKEKLIKEGKIKKQKPLPEITEDEKPFETPQSWKWVYLGDVFDHNTGKALNGSDDNGVSLTYITTSNLYWDHFELDHLKTMPFTDDEITKCTVHQGDLLVCEGGDIGRSAIWNFDYDMRIQNHIHRLRPYVNIDVRYFYYVMMYLKNNGSIRGRGIGLQGLSSKALHVIRVPLPPLAEQKRIVAKLEELLSLCDQLK